VASGTRPNVARSHRSFLVQNVWLAQLAWGWFLRGVGVLILAAQIARWQMDMEVEGFWLACGIVFLVGGRQDSSWK
jgi:hypothetical protein